MLRKPRLFLSTLAIAVGFGGAAMADSISPLTFSADLAVGESVTIEKTVVVDDSPPTDASLDVHFLFDTSLSMGGAIDAAKNDASAILSGLSGFGDLAVGVGAFSENASISSSFPTDPPGNVINSDLTTDLTAAQSSINAITLGDPDGGGDFPERGQDAVALAAENVSWRPGSSRFIVALGDASWKNDLTSDADAIAALAAEDITLIGLRFSNFVGSIFDTGTDDTTFTESVEDLGGTAFATGTATGDIVASILAGVSASFEDYSTVTVDDLGGGLPEIDVMTTCLTADIGTCIGAEAVGDYDRSEERTFTFEVTFTRIAEGDVTFETYALVDGGIVAREVDTFGGDVAPIPLPAAGWMLLAGIGGLGALRRRQKRRAA